MTVEKTVGYYLNFDEQAKKKENVTELKVIEKTANKLVLYICVDWAMLLSKGKRDSIMEI